MHLSWYNQFQNQHQTGTTLILGEESIIIGHTNKQNNIVDSVPIKQKNMTIMN